jgi:hypothetical protein
MGLQRPAQRNKPAETTPGRRRVPVPIGSLASGSGAVNIILTYKQYMTVAGRARRLQPPLLVNYNEAEHNRITQLLEPRQGAGRVFAILPRHIHANPEGFGGDPTAWKEDEGLITLDLEELATRSQAYAHRIGSQPAVILEFLVAGGGHAELGLLVHRALTNARLFPNALYLPVCLIPDDATQNGWLRVYTWEKYEAALAGLWGLWIDNAASPHAVINDRVAIGLTSLDACSSSVLTSGSLRQAVNSVLNAMKHQLPAAGNGQDAMQNGFFRLAVIRTALPSTKAWHWGFPLRQRKLIRSSTNDLEYGIRNAIYACLETSSGLLDTNPLPKAGIHQVVAVSVPVKPETLSDIVQSVKAILSREAWWGKHKDTTNLLWGAVNFPDPAVLDVAKPVQSPGWVIRWRNRCFWLITVVPRLLHRLFFGANHTQRELYITVTRLFPEMGAMQRLQHILQPGVRQPDGVGETGRGFGTREHLLPTPPPQNSHEDKEPVPK